MGERHRGIPGDLHYCWHITIHTSPLPVSGIRGKFSTIYCYARSARLGEDFDCVTKLLTVTSSPFTTGLPNDCASRTKPNMARFTACAKWCSTTVGRTTSDVRLAGVRVPRAGALTRTQYGGLDLSRIPKPPRAVRRAEGLPVRYWPHSGMTGCTLRDPSHAA